MKNSIKKGFGFGLTSGIITTLGLMVGLYSSTESRLVVIGGIILIAVSDALSDAFGVHISEESENDNSHREVWESTFATFSSKFVFALTFLVPVLIFPLKLSIVFSVIWGLLLISIFSFYISKERKEPSSRMIIEHLVITVFVLAVTYFIGRWINGFMA